MEFDLNTFTNRLRELMSESPIFPYDYAKNPNMPRDKHPTRPLHIKDVTFLDNPILPAGNTYTFELGNVFAEEKYPYYHILEDAPVIRKRNRATDKTKGSQAQVITTLRDYGKVKISVSGNKWKYQKEYQRNVRGKRSRYASISHHYTDYNGLDVWVNREANSYENKHYHYIERILNSSVLDQLASEFGLRRMRTIDAGLEEEYKEQTGHDSNFIEETIQNMLNSF